MKSIGQVLFWIAVIASLLLIPAAGMKAFKAVTNEMGNKEPAPIELKDINRAPEPQAATGKDPEAAKELYLEGLKYFQAADYEKAREQWLEAQELDPYNQQVQEGLKRAKEILDKAPE